MTLEETIDLLGTCAGFDQRTIGRTDAVAWHTVLGDLPLNDSQTAVIAYYRDNRERIMPADIRKRVLAIRRERLEHSPPPAPVPELADQPVRYRETLSASIRSIADGRQLRNAIADGVPRGTGALPADEMAALKARLGGVTQKLTPQERALLQAEESRLERELREKREAAG
jgi:hypothetical protein